MAKQISPEQRAFISIYNSHPQNIAELAKQKRTAAEKYSLKILSNSTLLDQYNDLLREKRIIASPKFKGLLKKRGVRTISGIAPVAVLTKPYKCPGTCVFCPTEKNVPQSYLSNEPAVMRAIRCDYDPYEQVRQRIYALEKNGHEPTKIELIVIGGTWSVLPIKYKYWFIGRCFEAANEYNKKITNYKLQITNKYSRLKIQNLKDRLAQEQRKNEKTKYKIIGLTLETRPDYIDERELGEMRELGCTRVELGVQAIDDKILKLNKRGHDVRQISEATRLLKEFGFKVTYHLMPNLPGSTAHHDLAMFKQLFKDERFQPDQIKFYPTVVTKGTVLYRWWRAGKYRPYTKKVLQNLIIKCKAVVPGHVRIIRLIRDIPEESIEAGNIITNLRQIMQAQGAECRCIRCREVKDQTFSLNDLTLNIDTYQASGGTEYFISFTNQDKKMLFGFCRLRLPGQTKKGIAFKDFTILSDTGIIRELHVYGKLISVGQQGKVQHTGLGKRLLRQAETITRRQGYKKIAVISGIGARNYYRKLGYRLVSTYLSKKL
jgi:elongator complex protein 3